ncbi:MAG: D-aminoacylase [Chloroflexi bacterium]|nr:D-aminoacylase [Chloroflexota bacterium]
MLDLLIRNGLIVDGTGSPGFYGAVGAEGDQLRILRGDVSQAEAARVIDATGHVVCPGFIDMHSHGGLTILKQPRHEPKVRQGITTELIGIDGNSVAPFKTRKELRQYMELDCGLNDRAPENLNWSSVSEFLSLYDDRVAVNICYILGNSPVRIWGVGWNNRPATGDELEEMKAVVREAMEEGAFGLSTGLDYPPGSFADTNELVELSKVVAAMGGFYHTHTRSDLRRQGLLAPWEEALEIGRKSGSPVHLTHYRQSAQGVGSHLDYLGLVEKARGEGLDVTFDCYPYIYSGTRAVAYLPQWTMDGGLERLMRALRSKADRDRIKKEIGSNPQARDAEERWLTNFQKPENKQYEGQSLADIARLRGQEEVDALCDLFLEDGLQISWVGVRTNPQTLPAFVSHPCGMVGSDAILMGEFPSPRSYGCFPVILAEFVRAEKQLRLPEAIRKMTSFPAQRLDLRDRGLLRDGMKADIVVFNPDTVKTPATRRNPRQFPQGIPYVIVNGKVVIDNGNHTGALPGRALRHGR